MKNISLARLTLTLAAAETKCFWRSAAAGLSLLVFLGFLGFFFYNGVAAYVFGSLEAAAQGRSLDASLALFSQGLAQVGFVLLLVAPLATMKSLATFKRGGHLDFYQSLPAPRGGLILGAYLAAFVNLTILLALSLVPFGVLLWAGVGSWEIILSSYLGLLCLASSFAALGLLASAASPSPMGAALGSLGLTGLMWMLGWAAPYMDKDFGRLWQGLAFAPRLNRFVMGLVDLNDVFFFLALTGLALYSAGRFLDARAAHGAD
ncbi:MAG: hypothetical protein LBS31_00980 [Candidatus Adiutrix sp.]|nr:hypothetical protein [Candidatus Adiutrix sp.]